MAVVPSGMADGPGRIAVIDDEPAVVRGFCATLHLAGGYEAVGFSDPRRAVAEAEREPFALALLDLVLPGGDGLGVLRRLRQVAPHMPVVVVTGANQSSLVVECLRAGAADYLLKPVPGDELVARVAAHLARSAASAGDERTLLAALRAQPRLPDQRRWKDMLVEEALRRHGGNLSQAAASIGLTRQALHQARRKRQQS